jgi:hypothetical protein
MHQPATRRPMTDSRYTEMGGRGLADQFFSLIQKIALTVGDKCMVQCTECNLADFSSLHALVSNAMLAPEFRCLCKFAKH